MLACLLAQPSIDVNVRDVDGSTALHAASDGGHEKACRLLLDRGANVSLANAYLDTPLHAAAKEGHLETARLLVAYGAEAAATNKFGVTPLEWARRTQRGEHWEEVCALLEKEGMEMHELAPGERAERKLRAAVRLQRQKMAAASSRSLPRGDGARRTPQRASTRSARRS